MVFRGRLMMLRRAHFFLLSLGFLDFLAFSLSSCLHVSILLKSGESVLLYRSVFC